MANLAESQGRRPGTIASYVTVANTFNAFPVAEVAPTKVSAITREHVEPYLAELFDRTAPVTVAKHYRVLPVGEVGRYSVATVQALRISGHARH